MWGGGGVADAHGSMLLVSLPQHTEKFHTPPTLALGAAECQLGGCVGICAGTQSVNLRSCGDRQRAPLLNPLI